MKRENKETIISLIKIKKLVVSEMEKALKEVTNDSKLAGIYSSRIQNNNTEIKILDAIVKSEVEK